MLDIICSHTNEEAERVYSEWNMQNQDKEQKVWKPVSTVEVRAFIGVLIMAGSLRCNNQHVKEMWGTKEDIRRPIFTAAMGRERFLSIYRFLRFDDKSTRVTRREHDRLAAIREIWDMFVANCKHAFVPYEHITVDEQLVSFRGKCPFRQYMKSKPAKYGIKIWLAADSKSSYCYNMQVYCGKSLTGEREKNQGERVVLDLIEPLAGSGRGVTTDNFFTSVSLAEKLLEKNLTLVGTLRKNKPDIPALLTVSKGREINSSLFLFSEKVTVVSYVPKKNKMVLLLSTQHADGQLSADPPNKPQIIMDYNMTKGGVDNADKLVGEKTCARKTLRWPFRIFMKCVYMNINEMFKKFT
jgi:hypothetical protein